MTSRLPLDLRYVDTSKATAGEIAKARATLSDHEHTRCDRFHSAEDRRDYACAHDLLRRSLSRYAGVAPEAWRFETTADGRPVVCRSQPQLVFSLTHIRGFVACAIAYHGFVGVDAERLQAETSAEEIAGASLSPTEAVSLARYRAEARAQRTIELWTLKEAFLKATGRGLSRSPRELSFEIGARGGIRFVPPVDIDGSGWQFELFAPDRTLRLAVARHCT